MNTYSCSWVYLGLHHFLPLHMQVQPGERYRAAAPPHAAANPASGDHAGREGSGVDGGTCTVSVLAVAAAGGAGNQGGHEEGGADRGVSGGGGVSHSGDSAAKAARLVAEAGLVSTHIGQLLGH